MIANRLSKSRYSGHSCKNPNSGGSNQPTADPQRLCPTRNVLQGSDRYASQVKRTCTKHKARNKCRGRNSIWKLCAMGITMKNTKDRNDRQGDRYRSAPSQRPKPRALAGGWPSPIPARSARLAVRKGIGLTAAPQESPIRRSRVQNPLVHGFFEDAFYARRRSVTRRS
jgi:hypothetical protein